MSQLDKALYKIIGKARTYMRPLFYDTNENVLQLMRDLRYHVVQSDIGTWDWAWANPKKIQYSVNKFKRRSRQR